MDRSIFDSSSYIDWHNREFPDDAPLDSKLENLITSLKEESASKFNEVQQVLSKIRACTNSQGKIQSGFLLEGECKIPIDSFDDKSPNYEGLFKSKESIINKLWRKNKNISDNNYIKLENINERIVDLVRASIVAPTMFHADLFAKHLENWKVILGEDIDVNTICPNIEKIEVDKEAQLASGYFAYHALVVFKDSYRIEFQIYSQLTSAWRAMSHKIYESERIGDEDLTEPGSPNSRLVSLGHMLHLAECELGRLQSDLAKYRRTSAENK